MQDAIKTTFEADGTIMALLTGGVHVTGEISRQITPTAFDGSAEILPCCLIKEMDQVPTGDLETTTSVSTRLRISVLFYQRSGYDVISQARARAFALLHRQRLDQAGVWTLEWTDDVIEQRDGALGCSLEIARYVSVQWK